MTFQPKQQDPKRTKRFAMQSQFSSNSSRLGYRRSALSSRNFIHLFRNGLPLETVSESPMIHRCRFGRVMATIGSQTQWFQDSDSGCRYFAKKSRYPTRLFLREIKLHRQQFKPILGDYLPFNLLFSPRNPTSFSVLLLTRLTMTASFSLP